MKLNVGEYAKALIAAVVAGYAMFELAIEPVIVDGTVIEAAGHITRVELYRIIGAMVAALGLVAGVPNSNYVKVRDLELITDPAIEYAERERVVVQGDNEIGQSER